MWNKAQEEGSSSNTKGLPSNDSWSIKRMVEANEIKNGKLMLEYHEKLDDVYILNGGRKAVSSQEGVPALLRDVTEDPPEDYDTALQKAPRGVPFSLIWGGVIRDRRLKLKDKIEIELSYDASSGAFQLKLLRREA